MRVDTGQVVDQVVERGVLPKMFFMLCKLMSYILEMEAVCYKLALVQILNVRKHFFVFQKSKSIVSI